MSPTRLTVLFGTLKRVQARCSLTCPNKFSRSHVLSPPKFREVNSNQRIRSCVKISATPSFDSVGTLSREGGRERERERERERDKQRERKREREREREGRDTLRRIERESIEIRSPLFHQDPVQRLHRGYFRAFLRKKDRRCSNAVTTDQAAKNRNRQD